MNSFKIKFLGGLGEIGMNCMLFETESEIIMIDCGVLYSDMTSLGVECVAPNFEYLNDKKNKFKTLVLTHGHDDHIGAIPLLWKAGFAPKIISSPFTKAMVEERLQEHGFKPEFQIFENQKSFRVGDFEFEPFFVNHSIVESFGFVIQTPTGILLHTGDFRFDENPVFGQSMDLTPIQNAAAKGIHILLSDSTNVENKEKNPSENHLVSSFEQIFAEHPNQLIIFSTFASNLARLKQIIDTAAKHKRKVIPMGRSVVDNIRLGQEFGYLQKSDPIFSIDEIDSNSREKICIIASGSQGEPRSSLYRLAYGMQRNFKIQKNDVVVFSSKFIPGNEKAISRMMNEISRKDAIIIHNKDILTHVSGHANYFDLKKILEISKPKFFIPIHGEYQHLKRHAELARDTLGSEQKILVAENGDTLLCREDKITITEKIEHLKNFVDHREMGLYLNYSEWTERKHLAKKGVISISIQRVFEGKKLILKFKWQSKGLTTEKLRKKIGDEIKTIVLHASKNKDLISQKTPATKWEEYLKTETRRLCQKHLGEKPEVLVNVF